MACRGCWPSRRSVGFRSTEQPSSHHFFSVPAGHPIDQDSGSFFRSSIRGILTIIILARVQASRPLTKADIPLNSHPTIIFPGFAARLRILIFSHRRRALNRARLILRRRLLSQFLIHPTAVYSFEKLQLTDPTSQVRVAVSYRGVASLLRRIRRTVARCRRGQGIRTPCLPSGAWSMSRARKVCLP